MRTDIREIEAEAQRELADEQRREQIDAAKRRIKERDARPIWQRLFPFKITITKRT